MDHKLLQLVKIYTTPHQLRQMAARLEHQMEKAVLGDELPKIVDMGQTLEVHFIVDPDAWNDEVRRWKQEEQ